MRHEYEIQEAKWEGIEIGINQERETSKIKHENELNEAKVEARTEGIAIGKMQVIENMILNMAKEECKIDFIARMVKLPVEEIERILKEHSIA